MPPAPIDPHFFSDKDYLKNDGFRKIYAAKNRKRYYTWDYRHREVEVFSRRGDHLGSVDPTTGKFIKPPKRGRTLNV